MQGLMRALLRPAVTPAVCAVVASALCRSNECEPPNGQMCLLGSEAALNAPLPSLEHAKEVPIVGGHAGLLSSDGLVYKPLPAGKRGEAELRFYATMFSPERYHSPPATLMPRFAGLHLEPARPGAKDGSTFLRLEDVTAPYVRPCIMDIKIGVQAWDEDATPAKIAKEACKYPTQQLVGFRLTGMRVWDHSRGMSSHALAPEQLLASTNGGYREHGRAFGYRLTQSALGSAFREFLFDGTRVRSELLPPFLDKLLLIREWFAAQDEFRFYGSSLLFVYEGDPAAAAVAAPPESQHSHRQMRDGDSTTGTAAPVTSATVAPRVDVRMIDFAHVFPIVSSVLALPKRADGQSASPDRPVTTEDRDSGYLLGLDSIIRYMLVLLTEHDAVAAEKYQRKWLEQQASMRTPLMIRGHHFHHVNSDGDQAALEWEPGAADAAAAALAGGAATASLHALAKTAIAP